MSLHFRTPSFLYYHKFILISHPKLPQRHHIHKASLNIILHHKSFLYILNLLLSLFSFLPPQMSYHQSRNQKQEKLLHPKKCGSGSKRKSLHLIHDSAKTQIKISFINIQYRWTCKNNIQL